MVLNSTEKEILEELMQYHSGLSMTELSTQLHQGYPVDFDEVGECRREEYPCEGPEYDMRGPKPEETKKAVTSLMSRNLVYEDRNRYYLSGLGARALLTEHLGKS